MAAHAESISPSPLARTLSAWFPLHIHAPSPALNSAFPRAASSFAGAVCNWNQHLKSYHSRPIRIVPHGLNRKVLSFSLSHTVYALDSPHPPQVTVTLTADLHGRSIGHTLCYDIKFSRLCDVLQLQGLGYGGE